MSLRAKMVLFLGFLLAFTASLPSRPPAPPPSVLYDAYPMEKSSLAEGPVAGNLREYSLILSNAPPPKALDIVIVGDGYTSEDLAYGGLYDRHVSEFIASFFSEPPFSELKHFCNLHLIRVISREAGADRQQHEDLVDTAFDATYGAYGIDRLLIIRRPEKLSRIVKLAPEQDIVIVLVNDSHYGGSGSTINELNRTIPAPVYAAGNPKGIRIALHELGHSLANLADEYVDESIAHHYSLSQISDKPNVDITSDLSRIKWRAFFEIEPEATNVIKAFEGAYYRSRGVWRPEKNCLMRELDQTFCHICRKELTRAIYQIANRHFDEQAYHRNHPVIKKY